jgi:hypothetical protein
MLTENTWLAIALAVAVLTALGTLFLPGQAMAAGGKHLFILSGQSNMVLLHPGESFVPAVNEAFGSDKVIVVHDAEGGQPIRRWYKDWKPANGDEPEATGDLYDRLMKKVRAAMEGQSIETVTLVWMQGESDANQEHGSVYAASLRGLRRQFEEDLGHKPIHFVIGRISGYGLVREHAAEWRLVRAAQVEVADNDPPAAWVDTDDLNTGLSREGVMYKNDIHYSAEGYKILGRRFAEKAIALILEDVPAEAQEVAQSAPEP